MLTAWQQFNNYITMMLEKVCRRLIHFHQISKQKSGNVKYQWSFWGSKSQILKLFVKFHSKWSFWIKIEIMTPKMLENILILTAVKNYTSYFSYNPFGPDYCIYSNVSLTAPSNQPYFQCIFKIYQFFSPFSKQIYFNQKQKIL